MTDDFEKLKNEGEPIIIGGKEFKAKALVFVKYKELLKEIPKIVTEFARQNPDVDTSELKANPGKYLGSFIVNAGDIFLKYLAMTIDADTEFLENNMTMVDMSDLAEKFCRLNNLGRVVKNFQKLGTEVTRQMKKEKGKEDQS